MLVNPVTTFFPSRERPAHLWTSLLPAFLAWGGGYRSTLDLGRAASRILARTKTPPPRALSPPATARTQPAALLPRPPPCPAPPSPPCTPRDHDVPPRPTLLLSHLPHLFFRVHPGPLPTPTLVPIGNPPKTSRPRRVASTPSPSFSPSLFPDLSSPRTLFRLPHTARRPSLPFCVFSLAASRPSVAFFVVAHPSPQSLDHVVA